MSESKAEANIRLKSEGFLPKWDPKSLRSRYRRYPDLTRFASVRTLRTACHPPTSRHRLGVASLGCRLQLAQMRSALFEPEIAGNVGAVLRLGACLGAEVDLIEPKGFAWDDRSVRRAAMDYIDHVAVARHADSEAFRLTIAPRRLVLFTTKSSQSAYAFEFVADDVLLFGKESAGVPSSVADACDARLRIPTRPQVRSLNLAMTAALALGEALRQTATLPA